jgi:signal transduction histidine kinase
MVNRAEQEFSDSLDVRIAPPAELLAAALMEMTPGWVLACDADGFILLANPSAREALALADGRFGTMRLAEIIATEQLVNELPESGRSTSFEAQVVLANGTLNSAKVRATGFSDFTLVFLEPTAERRVGAEHVTQAQKLEAIGQLAAGIAHEINTPTQYVGDNTRFLKDAFTSLTLAHEKLSKLLTAAKQGGVSAELIHEVESSLRDVDTEFLMAEVPAALDQSLEGLEQIARIVRAMKEFSHPGMGEKSFLDVNNAIENTLTVARNEWKYVADLVTNFDPALPLIPCFPGAFNQVLLNIIVNAAHAIEDALPLQGRKRGTITIDTRQVGDSVEVRIADTGVGIPEHVRSRVYDPFFTTKEVGRGTGQGLALSYSIVVEQHGGSISFESVPGEGTTFILRLPASVAPTQGSVE